LAKLSAVITVLGDVLGMPESAVESYVKPLRRAGLITSGPRGTAAPDIPAGQMALCLIAILNGSPAHAVEKAIYFGGLESTHHAGTETRQFMAHYDLEPGHTFIEMLTNLIHFHSDGSNYMRLMKAAQKVKILSDDEMAHGANLFENQVAVENPELFVLFFPRLFVDLHDIDADIVFSVDVVKQPICSPSATSRRRADYQMHYHYPGTFDKGPFGEWRPRPRPKPESDLERTYRVSEETLYRLGELLKPGN